jgi:hypothetical protein
MRMQHSWSKEGKSTRTNSYSLEVMPCIKLQLLCCLYILSRVKFLQGLDVKTIFGGKLGRQSTRSLGIARLLDIASAFYIRDFS